MATNLGMILARYLKLCARYNKQLAKGNAEIEKAILEELTEILLEWELKNNGETNTLSHFLDLMDDTFKDCSEIHKAHQRISDKFKKALSQD